MYDLAKRRFILFVFRQIVTSHLLKWWWIMLPRGTVSWRCPRVTLYRCSATVDRCITSVDELQMTHRPALMACCRIMCWWWRTSLIMASG